MVNKVKNSSLIPSLGYYYQTLIALEKCFLLRENQSVFIEIDGDISFVDHCDNSSSIQYESKNYDSSNLTDSHKNFWKTLSNWLDASFSSENYGALILHTTQPFGTDTLLKNWNISNASEKLEILKEIYNNKSDRESSDASSMTKLQASVINSSNQERLLSIIDKFTIETDQDDFEATYKNIENYLQGIPSQNRGLFVNSLIGFVYRTSSKNNWEIKKDDFERELQVLTFRFCENVFTFPAFGEYELDEEKIGNFDESLFVKKIKDIEHDEYFILDAISNYLELQNSYMDELHGNILYKKYTEKYKKRLIKNFMVQYSTACLNYNVTDDCIIKKSKILYNNTTSAPSMRLEDREPPIEYRNGLLHDAMNTNKNIKWKIEV